MLNSRLGQYGVTLVELMVVIVVLGIMIAFAVPSYRDWIQNQQTRAAAESILNGMQFTRNTAVGNNTTARFELCRLTSSNWEVMVAASAPASAPVADAICGVGATNEFRVQERNGLEGSRNVVVTTVPGGATTVTFNSLGRVTANADSSVPITSVTINTPTGSRSLQVNVGGGGNVRMCDPASSLAITDPRHC